MNMKSDHAPHDCPQCGNPAYIGFGVNPKCTNLFCPWFDRETYVEHVLSLPDPGDPEEDIDEEAETQPRGKQLAFTTDGIDWMALPDDYAVVDWPARGSGDLVDQIRREAT